MPAIIHLFEIEGLEEQGSPYHHPALRSFFKSLLAVDEKATIAFGLWQGDLLLDTLTRLRGCALSKTRMAQPR